MHEYVSPPARPLLEIDQVSRRFGGIRAVEACSFAIERGSITGLIGPNGAGKTTLFNMVAGALPPTAGRILFDGEDITGQPAHRLFAKGIVRTFQIPHEFGRMTVLENLLLVPAAQRGEQLVASWFGWKGVQGEERRLRERAREVLAFLGLDRIRNELAANLSGGQKKLLEIGRTMMTEPRLVLLDEPGAGVNRTLLRTIRDAIRRLNEARGYTFCIIEHDMGFVAELCEPVVCMAEGSVLTIGTMAEVRADPRVREAYLGHGGEVAA